MSERIPRGIICEFDGERKEIVHGSPGEGLPEIGEDLMREFARRLYFNYKNYIMECQRRGVELGSRIPEEAAR